MSQTRQYNFKTILQGVGICSSIPYATLADQHFMVGYKGNMNSSLQRFYRGTVPIVIMGTFANNYYNFGQSIDLIIEGCKTFPYPVSYHDLKQWLWQVKSENVGYVCGAFFGTVLASYFIYTNSIRVDPIFNSKSGAEVSTP